MGSIRSFDGRNCEWLIKYTRAVSGSPGSHSVATPWPPCWLIKYTRAVSVPYVPYSVATPWPHLDVAFYTVSTPRCGRCPVRMVRIPWAHRCQRILKLLRLNPAVVSLPTGSLVSLILSVKATISGDGHAKIASWRPRLFDCLRSFAKLEPRVGQ